MSRPANPELGVELARLRRVLWLALADRCFRLCWPDRRRAPRSGRPGRVAAELAQVFYMAAARAQAYEVRCQSWVDEPEPDDNVSDSHVTFVFADEATQESRFAWSCHVNSDPVTEEQVREAFKRFSLQDQQPNRLPGCPRCFNPDVRRERTIGREVQSVTHSCPRCWWRWTESHPLPPPTKRP